MSISGKRNTLPIRIIEPVTAFGEVSTATPNPRIQIDATYGIRTTDVETFTDGVTGSVDTYDGTKGIEFKCSSGTNAGGYAVVRSRKSLRYRTGQGAVGRFTARYTTPAANSGQRVGFINVGVELSFGYDGTQFGILHRTGGRVEIRTLTLSAAATGNETATITLNGTAFNVALTSGTAAHNAYQIAASTFTGWNVGQNGSTIIFTSTTVGSKSGAYSFSSTGTAAGTIAQNAPGAAAQDAWYYQNQWNGYKLLGGVSDPFTLDHTKGNVYEIRYQYLGYGAIEFGVEDPNTGRFITVHRIKYANTNASPSLDIPIMKLGAASFNLGNTTDTVVYSASLAGFVEGKMRHFRASNSQINSKASIGTQWVSLLQIRNRRAFANRYNLAEMLIHDSEIAVEGTKPAEIALWLNPTISGEPNWQYINTTTSIAEYDTVGATITAGQLIYAAGLGKSSNKQIDLEKLDVRLSNGDVLALAARASSGTIDATGALVWVED